MITIRVYNITITYNITKSKAIKFIVKKYSLIISKNENIVSCKKYTVNHKLSVTKTKQIRLMLLSTYAICGKKKRTFIKNIELRNLND